MGCFTMIGIFAATILMIWFFETVDGVVLLAIGIIAILALIIYLNCSEPTSSSGTKKKSRVNTSGVTGILIRGDYKVREIDDKGIQIVSYIGVDGATIKIPENIDGIPVRSIGKAAFQNCTNVEVVFIPFGVFEIQDDAFCGCKRLRSVSLPSTIKTIGNSAFQGCNALKAITLPRNIEHIAGNAFWREDSKEKLAITLNCYANSYGLQYARQYQYNYKDAEQR